MKKKLFMYGGTLLAGVGLGACVAKSPTVGAAIAPPASRAEAVPGYDANNEPTVKVVQKVAPAIVSIDTTAKVTGYVRTGFFDEAQRVTREVPRGQGSGVLLEGGYVLTNEHVVGDSVRTGGRVNVNLADGRKFTATPVGSDRQSDIALLKVDGAKNLPFASPGVEDKLLPGQQVIAIGNPVGLSASVSSGIVSAVGRPLETEGRIYENLIQTDTAINPGNSGGALIDMGGRVVGINTLVRADAQNIGFAIPIQTAMRIVDQLKRTGSVQRPDLGFKVADFRASDGEVPDGVAIVNPEGDAAGVLRGARPSREPGMLVVRDVLLSVNGVPTPTTEAFRKAISNLKIGQQAEVTIWRDGQTGKTRIPVVPSS